MDILSFKRMTAEESIAQASIADPDGDPQWENLFTFYVNSFVPKLRAFAPRLGSGV